MSTTINRATVLTVSCPWCLASPGEPCTARAVSFRRARGANRPRTMANPHDARVQAATGLHAPEPDAWEDWEVPPRRVTGPVPHGDAERH